MDPQQKELFLKNVHPNSLERGQNYWFHDKPVRYSKNGVDYEYVGRPKRAMFDSSFSKKTMTYDKDGNFTGWNGPPLPGPHTHATLTDENGYRGWMSTMKLDEPGKITQFQFTGLPDDVNKQINQYVGGNRKHKCNTRCNKKSKPKRKSVRKRRTTRH